MEAAAVVDIGLSRSEFWALTPRQFWNLFDRHTSNEIRHSRDFHQLTALFARANLKRDRPFTVDDFAPPMPGTKPVSHVQSGRELLTAMKVTHELLAAKGAPKGAFGQLSQEELDELYADRHRIYPQFGNVQ